MQRNTTRDNYLDLRGYVCPVNFVKCSIALEKLPLNEVLRVDLDAGEAEKSVVEGLIEKGYKVYIKKRESQMITLIISSE